MATDERIDPYRSFNFVVDIDNTPEAGFSEVSGLMNDGDLTEYREGNEAENHVRKLPALRKFGIITLKHGYTKSDTFWQWYTNIANGIQDRRNGSVVLYDEAHNPVMRWNFENGWPNKVEAPSFNATGNDVAIESIELCIEKLILEIEGA